MWGEAVGHRLSNELSNRMNKTSGTEVSNVLVPILLWDKSNIGGVQPMELSSKDVGNMVDDKHNVFFDSIPTCHEKGARETIRAWRLVIWYGKQGSLGLLLGKSLSLVLKITVGSGDDLLTEVNLS